MDQPLIYGIQQMGLGVENADEAFKWYATKLGFDVVAFDDNNTATHMAPYMGGEPRNKRALLAMNLHGGGGFEIWQYTERKPSEPKKPINLGDLGILQPFIKTRAIEKSFKKLKEAGVNLLSDISELPDGRRAFHFSDPYGNILSVQECRDFFLKKGNDLGGIFGCLLGVSDIDKSLPLYSGVLGYDKVISDKSGVFEDLKGLPKGDGKFRRVRLTHSEKRTGGFSNLFGATEIELIQSIDNYQPVKIFENRYWGDQGYIHVCFDIRFMDAMVEKCKNNGTPFTVLSNPTFEMGEASGHWGYIEDEDGTLVEFVETHKLPVLKKFNINIDLIKRDPKKPLPNWILKALRTKRKRF